MRLLAVVLLLATWGVVSRTPRFREVYDGQLQQRADVEWLRTRCTEPIFFARMLRQHPSICADAMVVKSSGDPPIVVALLACLPSMEAPSMRAALWGTALALIGASVYMLPVWHARRLRAKTEWLCHAVLPC